jgi:hypothetical protein
MTTKEIVELGIDDPEIISLMGFLEDGVGPDTISDLATNAILPALEEITAQVCHDYKIPRQRHVVEGLVVLLPTNPFSKGRSGIALVPLDVLRDLPIATDWSDISRVAFENEQIRQQVNELIADFAKATIRQKKAALRRAALQSKRTFRAMFDGLIRADKAYDRTRGNVRLITRNGNDFTDHFPFIVMAVKSLPARSCVIDGEAIVCNEKGLAVFELIRRNRCSDPNDRVGLRGLDSAR